MFKSINKNKVFWFSLITIKLILFCLFGVQSMPDSSSYLELSENIKNDFFSVFKFEDKTRMIGYPLIIYLTKILSTENWIILLGFFQISFSLFTLFFVNKTLKKLSISNISAKLIILLFSFSTINKLDLLLLTDSIYGNLMVLIFCNFFLIYQTNQKIKITKYCFAISFLLIVSFLIKDTTIIFIPFFGIFFIILIIKFIKKKISVYKCFLYLLLIFLPVFLISEIIKLSNYKKQGYKYITVGGSTIYYYATVKPYLDRNLKIFDSENDYDKTYKKYIKNLEFSGVYNMINDLENQGYTKTEILEYSKDKYIRVILNPLNLLNIIQWNLKPTFIWGTFQPFLSISQLYSLKIDDNSYWRTRLIIKKILTESLFDWNIILFSFCLLEIIFTTFLFLLFVKISLVNLKNFYFRKVDIFSLNDNRIIIILSIIFYLLFCLLHLIVHMEPRYMVGVNFLFIFSIITNYDSLIKKFIRKFG